MSVSVVVSATRSVPQLEFHVSCFRFPDNLESEAYNLNLLADMRHEMMKPKRGAATHRHKPDKRRHTIGRGLVRGLAVISVFFLHEPFMSSLRQPIKEGLVCSLKGTVMDPQRIQEKVDTFAQRLLSEAHGDPVKALGLLVLVLDTAEFESVDHMKRLIAEVRQALMSDGSGSSRRPIQHLAGDVSWEGLQHCLRCGKVLARNCGQQAEAPHPGYVYEQGARLTSDDQDDFALCTDPSE